jgi:hypothetical protein
VAQTWEYDGVDLTTLGYNVRLLGAPVNVPPRRGENVVLPSRTGRLYAAKRLDERTVSLAMFVKDTHPTNYGAGSETQLLANLDALRGLFARDGQHVLKHTMASSTRLATAEVVNAVTFEPLGAGNAFGFSVEFLLADPLWYAQTVTTVGPTTIGQSPQNITVTNGGTYRGEKAILTLVGPLSNPKLAIGATWVQFTGAVGAGQTLVLRCEDFTATLAGADVSGNVSHAGALSWLPLPVGVNTLAVTTGTLGGSVTVAWTAAFV